MFVSVLGLREDRPCPTVVDLCGIVGALLDLQSSSDGQSGHDFNVLIELANRHQRAYIGGFL